MSVYPEAESMIASSELEFDFDDIVVNSVAYRRALAAARNQGPAPPLLTPTNKRQKPLLHDVHLVYHDLCLTHQDMQTIKNDRLSENVVAFWEEYLEREILIKVPKSKEKIVLLRPSMSSLLMTKQDPLTLKNVFPDFEQKTHAFLPIYKCRPVDVAEDRSHWSLLLVSIVDSVAFHYDSLSPSIYSNTEEARLMSSKCGQLLDRKLKFIDLPDSPRQENENDSGVIMCFLMQHLLVFRLLRAHVSDKVSMSTKGMSVDTEGARKEMLRIVEAKRKDGTTRRP